MPITTADVGNTKKAPLAKRKVVKSSIGPELNVDRAAQRSRSEALDLDRLIAVIENHAEDIRLSTLEKFAEAIGKRLTLKIA